MKLGKILKLCIFVFIMAPIVNAEESRTYFNPRSNADGNVPPFSGAVLVGDTLYLSGTIGFKDGKVPEDPVEEARIVMNNIKRSVEAANMTMDDIVVMQVFCSDVERYYQSFNEAYRTFFKKEFPARAFLGSGTLIGNGRFEVQGIAIKR